MFDLGVPKFLGTQRSKIGGMEMALNSYYAADLNDGTPTGYPEGYFRCFNITNDCKIGVGSSNKLWFRFGSDSPWISVG